MPQSKENPLRTRFDVIDSLSPPQAEILWNGLRPWLLNKPVQFASSDVLVMQVWSEITDQGKPVDMKKVRGELALYSLKSLLRRRA